MTEDKYSKAKEIQETIILLKDKLDDFEEIKTLHNYSLCNPNTEIFSVTEHPEHISAEEDVFNQICKDALITMINNIKTRLRAEINNLETEFHEL